MDIFVQILTSNILPIFIAAGVGWLVAYLLHIEPKGLSQVAVNALLPALIFYTLITTRVSLGNFSRITVFCGIVILISAVLARGLAWIMHINKMETTALMLVVMFTNVGNFGLPLIAFAFGEDALAYGTIYFIVMNIFLYTLGVAMLSNGRKKTSQALLSLLKSPTIYAVLLAGVVTMFHIELPVPVLNAVQILSQGAVPVMLVVLGMQLFYTRLKLRPLVWLAAGLRLILVPVLAYPFVGWLGLNIPSTQAGMLQAATPAGVSTTVLALEYEVESDFVNSVVVITTLFCAVTLTPLIYFLQV